MVAMRTNPRTRFFSVLLVAVLIFSEFSFLEDSAARASGLIYFFTKENADGTVTVTDCTGCIGAISIPTEIDEKTVTKIGDGAFHSNQLSSVVIPSTVTAIGEGAFENNRLSSVDLPINLVSIGKSAFKDNMLSRLKIPTGIRTISESAFEQNLLSAIDLPANLGQVGALAFSDNLLSRVVFPGSVTTIGASAFMENRLSAVLFPASVARLDGYAFAHNRLKSIKFLGDCPDARPSVFVHNPALRSVKVIATSHGWKATNFGLPVLDFTGVAIAADPEYAFGAGLVLDHQSKEATAEVRTGKWLGFPKPRFSYEWFACTTSSQSASNIGKVTRGCTSIKNAKENRLRLPKIRNKANFAVRITAKNRIGSATVFTHTVGFSYSNPIPKASQKSTSPEFMPKWDGYVKPKTRYAGVKSCKIISQSKGIVFVTFAFTFYGGNYVADVVNGWRHFTPSMSVTWTTSETVNLGNIIDYDVPVGLIDDSFSATAFNYRDSTSPELQGYRWINTGFNFVDETWNPAKACR